MIHLKPPPGRFPRLAANWVRRFVSVLILLLMTASVAGARSPDTQKQILAFYHWNDWQVLQFSGSTDLPKLGLYNSQDANIVDQHFRWAADAGLTGFVVAWSGIGDQHDRTLRIMLDAAHRHGLRVTICYTMVPRLRNASIEQAIVETLYLVEQYRRHPAWLKVGGRFVMFVSAASVQELSLDGWKEVQRQVNGRHDAGVAFIGGDISFAAAAVFQGIFAPPGTSGPAKSQLVDLRDWAHSTFPAWVRSAGNRICTVTILPGGHGKAEQPALSAIPRHGGDTYRLLWEHAIAADPDWILIDSWNDWCRGTAIEPSTQRAHRDLRCTRRHSHQFVTNAEHRNGPWP